jgi:hypothetical protein
MTRNSPNLIAKTLCLGAAVVLVGVMAGQARALSIPRDASGPLYIYNYTGQFVSCGDGRVLRVNIGSSFSFQMSQIGPGFIAIQPTVLYYHYDFDQAGRAIGWRLKFADVTDARTALFDDPSQLDHDGLRTLPYGGYWTVQVWMDWTRIGLNQSDYDIYAPDAADVVGPAHGTGAWCYWA